MNSQKAVNKAADIDIRPLSPSGAEVVGIDASQPIDDAAAQILRDALARYHLLSFRGQTLTPGDQIGFLGLFGNVLDEFLDNSRHSYVSGGDGKNFKPGRLLFHSDNHLMPYPLEMLSLYAEDIDARAASTLFVDNAEGYKRLPAPLVEKLADARTVNVSYYMLGMGGDRPSRSVEPDIPEAPRASHPIFWRHPVSDAPFVYVTELHTHHIEDMPIAESDTLLGEVRSALYEPKGIYEHRWRQGDLVIWDNRLVQHARGDVPDGKVDAAAPPRKIRRVAVGAQSFNDQVAVPVML